MLMDRERIAALMERSSAGDEAAFSQLAAEVQDELFRLSLAVGLGRDDAAEAVQETLLRAYAGRSRWRRGSDALAWLCGITLNVAREFRRKMRPGPLAGPYDGQEMLNGLAATAAFSHKLESDERRQRLIQGLSELPLRQREAIACRYLRRMSIREAAAVLGCAEGTVKSAVFAGLERLRAILESER